MFRKKNNLRLKKILIAILASFLLFSCSSSEKESEEKGLETTEKSGLRYYPWKDFSIYIPASWNNITNNNEIIPTPNNWKIELAITSFKTKNGFANNLIILSQNLETFTTSKNYSITNNIWAELEYINYFKKSGKKFIFNDWEESMIYHFQAKYSEETPLLNFLQTAYVCRNNKAFFITIALSLDIKEVDKYKKMLATFKCS